MEHISIEQWFFMFFSFTLIGWVYESTVESLYHRKFINRGSLKGPYIPIYGFGGCLILHCCMPFKSNGFFVFMSGLVCCTILEYFTGWLMEKLFKMQFWDYSMLKLTYKNRISLLSSLCWGAMSLLMVYIIYPFMQWLGLSLGSIFMIIFDCIMLVTISADIIISVRKIMDFKELMAKLSPEQIKAVIHERGLKVGETFGHLSEIIHRRNENSPAKDESNNDSEA